MVRTNILLAGVALVSSVQSAKECKGQSCDIANISQSTNTAFDYGAKKRPNGGNRAGDMCIEKAWDKLGLPHPPGYGKGPPNYAKGGRGRFIMEDNALMARNNMFKLTKRNAEQEQADELEKRQLFGGGSCQPHTLLFSR